MPKKPIPSHIREVAEDEPTHQLNLDKRDVLFLNEYAKTKSLKKSAHKAFGDSVKLKHREPMKYAYSLMTRKAYDRAVIDYWTNIYGCTDAFLIRELAKGIIHLSWSDNKEGHLKLKCMQLMMDLKRMLPDKSSRQESVPTMKVDKMQQIIIGDRPLDQFVKDVRSNIKEEELGEVIEATLLAAKAPSVTKKYNDEELFASRSDLHVDKKGV